MQQRFAHSMFFKFCINLFFRNETRFPLCKHFENQNPVQCLSVICLRVEITFSDFYVRILVCGLRLITFNLPSHVSVLERQFADLAFFCSFGKAILESINIS